jgi:hypothetical protein
MALDPRFAPLIAALSGKAADIVGSGGATPTPAQGGTPGTTTATPQVDAALTNPNTAAALAGANAPSPAAQRAGNVAGLVAGAESGAVAQPQAPGAPNAQPGYGTSQPAQPSQLGGQPAPAAMSPEAAAQGAANAQTASELSMWDTILQNLTGRTPEGGMLSGDALKDFQQGHAIGGLLGALGAGIGGDTTGGRLGAAVYGQAAGGLAANNAERMQTNQNDFMRAAMAALAGSGGRSAQSPAGPTGPITQPSRSQYNPMTSSTPTGGTQPQSGSVQDQAGTPTMASLDESLARMRRLSGLA